MDRYEIRVASHLSERRARSLGCEELRLLPGGETLLVFHAVDQAGLYGLLARLRDAGVRLIAAERTPESVRAGTRPTQPSKEDSDAAV